MPVDYTLIKHVYHCGSTKRMDIILADIYISSMSNYTLHSSFLTLQNLIATFLPHNQSDMHILVTFVAAI